MTLYDRHHLLVAGWLWRTIGALSAALWMSWAFGESIATPLPNASQLTEPNEIFADRCIACHGLGVYAPTLDQLAKLRAERIESILWNGPMQEYAEGLNSGQRAMLARWIASLSTEKESNDPGVKACSDSPPSAGGQQWTGWSADAQLTRLSPSREFTAARTAGLELKWALPLPEGVPFRGGANPVAISNGRLYTGNFNNYVYSLDPNRACSYWTFRADGHVRSNVSIENGILVFGDTWANVYGLDALTGRLLWRVRVENLARVTGNITLHKGVAYVPVSTLQEGTGIRVDSPCCSFRGSVVALDAKTGAMKWRHQTIDAPLERIGQTRKGVPRYGPSGVPVWSGITVDEKRQRLYVTTGNQFSEPIVKESDAVLALDMATGARRWTAGFAPERLGRKDNFVIACVEVIGARQDGPCPPENSNSDGDRDFGAPASLVRLRNGRELVLAGSKDGMLYALNPDDGKLVWERRVGRGGEVGGIVYGIATDGERVYAPLADVEADLIADGSFKAVDIESGNILWSQTAEKGSCDGKPTPPCSNGFTTPPTVAGDVVFAGATDGILRAYERKSGKLIWSFDTVRDFLGPDGQRGRGGSLGFGGAVVVDDKLYIMSGHSQYLLGMGGNVLLAFQLPRKSK